MEDLFIRITTREKLSECQMHERGEVESCRMGRGDVCVCVCVCVGGGVMGSCGGLISSLKNVVDATNGRCF